MTVAMPSNSDSRTGGSSTGSASPRVTKAAAPSVGVAYNAVNENAVVACEGGEIANFDFVKRRRANLNGIAGPERWPHAGAGHPQRSATIRAKCLDEELAFPAVIGVYDSLRLKRHCA